MLLQNTADVILSEITLDQNIRNFQLLENKPVQLGGTPALRLVYTYRNEDFLQYKCVHYGFIHKKLYYELQYVATVQHNYDRGLEAFERMIQSFHVKQS